MTAVVYGFVRAASDGWTDRGSLASFIIGAALLATFVLTEMRAEQPITPLRLFASRSRSGALLARLMIVGGMFSFFFFISQYLQGVSDFSALKAGFAFLPMTVAMFAMVQVVPRVGARFGNARLMAGGVTLALVGMAWLSRLTVSTPYFPGIALPMILLGVGIGIAFIPLTAVAIAGVAPNDSGAASGLVNVAQQVGGSLGLAILITVFGSAIRSGGTDAKHQLAHGVGAALTGSTVFLALALTVILLLVRKPAAAAVPAETEAPEPVALAASPAPAPAPPPRLVGVTAATASDPDYEPEVDLGPAA
jgi:predicted MFS family arabinose efflux permease